jgi:putative ATP-dependent endonuclease of the OLD family
VLKKILIKNYRVFTNFILDFQPGMNILVGDNDTGKTTVLEAVNLALTGRVQGRLLAQELSPYVFNLELTKQYVQDLKNGTNPSPPEMIVDLFLEDTPDSAGLKGTNNLTSEDACGLRFHAYFNQDYATEYAAFIQDPDSVQLIPTEYYRCDWLAFSGNSVTARSVPATASMIDATSIRLQSGADYYVQGIITSSLDPKERVELTRAYRSLRQRFAEDDSIAAINSKLKANPGDVSNRDLSLGIDVSLRASWESSLVPHLDELPFSFVGKGEQSSLKILLALNRKVEDAHIILVEEPENHLSFSRMNILINKIKEKCKDKQVLVTTHSSFVLNKLGLGQLLLLTEDGGFRLTDLSEDTQEYFQKLSGYDTLRLILAKRAILVEGPSDELVVQRAYLDKHGHLPIEDGVDVINVRGLSFARFLEVAVPLGRQTAVVTDNDGNGILAVLNRYAAFTAHPHISVHTGADPNLTTLEPNLLAVNGLATMNTALGKNYADEASMLNYMTNNKTECALAIFQSETKIAMPDYIENALG